MTENSLELTPVFRYLTSVTPEDIAASYNQIASHWDGPDFDRTNGILQHERALQFITAPGLALDLGCGGSGRIIDLLMKRGFQVEGLDTSSEMLGLARRRHPDVQFYEADICVWEFPKKYDFISAWDSIWHVSLLQQPEVLRKICTGLKRNGVFIFTTGGLDAANHGTNACLGQPLYHATVGIPKILALLTDSGCSCRHLEYDQYPSSHLYLISQRT